MSDKAYKMLLSDRPYVTEIKKCDCYTQDCKGKFLTTINNPQTVCLNELHRINNYQKNLIN